MKTGALPKLLLAAFIVSLAGCGSFQKQWEHAGNMPSRDPFAGRWEGRWTSAKHKKAGGSLRCVLTKADERRYHGSFRAGWLAFHGTYSAEFEARRKGRELLFTGDRDLGPLWGGNYRFEGRATSEHFRASYESSYDRGVFEMWRLTGQTSAR